MIGENIRVRKYHNDRREKNAPTAGRRDVSASLSGHNGGSSDGLYGCPPACSGWIDAIRSGKPASSNFNVSGPLTEVVLLANLAIRTGKNVKLMWDGPNTKVTNVAEANQYVRREYRKGWSL